VKALGESGKIKIKFKSREELEKILELFHVKQS